jgi:hypothetical protein
MSTRLLPALHADVRSAALFRIAIAVAALAELAAMWPDRCVMYAANSLLPANGERWPLHGGTCEQTTVLFLTHAFALMMVLMGCCTRCAALTAFVLQKSLMARNPFVVTGDSDLLCASLLWTVLLRTDAVWAVDAPEAAGVAEAAGATSSRSLAALGLKLQIALFYLGTCFLKIREAGLPAAEGVERGPHSPWLAGTAVAEALSCCEYQRPLGTLLLSSPWLCALLTVSAFLRGSTATRDCHARRPRSRPSLFAPPGLAPLLLTYRRASSPAPPVGHVAP